MRTSVFSTIRSYLGGVYQAVKSIAKSCFTARPYHLSSSEYRKEFTEQYPDPISSRTADDLPPRTRGLLFNDIDRCTGCKDCQVICPTRCITVETEPGPDPSKTWVATFDIDFSRCIFCGLCVDVCQPQSLVHTRQYEGAVYVPQDMVASFGRGKVTPEQRAKWAHIRQMSESDEVGS